MKTEKNCQKSVPFLKRFLSFMLVVAMLVTSVPVTAMASETQPDVSGEIVEEKENTEASEIFVNSESEIPETSEIVEKPVEGVVKQEFALDETISQLAEEGTVDIVFHIKNADNWDSVALYAWNDENNNLEQLNGLKTWPGKQVTTSEGGQWYTYTIEDYPSNTCLKFILNNNNNGSQTANLCIAKAALEKYAGGVCEIWADTKGTHNIPVSLVDLENRTVTFSIEKNPAGKLYVFGDMNSWGEKDEMTDPDGDGIYSISLDLDYGKYEYKFKDNDGWYVDPNNWNQADADSNSNSVVVVYGLKGSSLTSYKGTISPLPTTLKFVDEVGAEESAGREVTYSFKNSEDANYAKLENGTLLVDESCTKDTLYLTASATVRGKVYTSTVTVTVEEPVGLKPAFVEGVRGDVIKLPAELDFVPEGGGEKTKKKVTYTVPESVGSDMATISETTNLTVSKKYAGETLELTASDGAGHTATVTVKLNYKYTYTIYARAEAHGKNGIENAGLHVWDAAEEKETSFVKGYVAFTETETLSDGNVWMKATIKGDLDDRIGFIYKNSGDAWNWKTSDMFYSNTTGAENINLYIVAGLGEIYDSIDLLPKTSYVYVDYTAAKESGLNTPYIYAWNNGYKFYDSNNKEIQVFYQIKNVGDRWIGRIPVITDGTDKTIGFLINGKDYFVDGGEKDGGDNYVMIPAGDDVVKVNFVDKKAKVLPYNKGSEINRAEGKIYFYYRDKEEFTTGTSGKTVKVKVGVMAEGATTVTTQEYPMTYNATTERYEYTMDLQDDVDYVYGYLVNGDEELVLDAYNKKTKEVDSTTYSLRRNMKYNVTFTASVVNATMDYNENNLLKISWAPGPGATEDDLEGFKIKEAYVDLSELGLSNKVAIDLEAYYSLSELGFLEDVDPADGIIDTMAISFGCLDTTELGIKKLPITIVDDCDVVYNNSAQVTIVERDKSQDFDWDEAVIYFAVTDRFNNGDTTNDKCGVEDWSGFDPNGGSCYHGGDIAGLIDKLDYLKDLGVNTIWITPIVMNIDTNAGVEGVQSYGYHGYWASDFEKLNPHLGNLEEFKTLINKVHERGMKIMVDVVLNHGGYGTEDIFNNKIESDVTDAGGNSLYKDMVRSESIAGDDEKKSLDGLPDFLTEDEDVRKQLIAWQVAWMKNYEIDYYRIDTVKHVDDTTWTAFKNTLTEINPEFKIIGEYFDAGYKNDYGQLDSGMMDSILDFNFNDTMMNLLNHDLGVIEDELIKRNTLLTNTATVGSFLSSHDEPGFIYTMLNSTEYKDWVNKGITKVAATYQITAKGQPVIYYGEELGQTGTNDYPTSSNRYDFDWSAQKSQDSDANSILNHYKKMLDIREEYSEVFAKGTRSQVVVSEEYEKTQGYDVFSREYNGTEIYVGINTWSDERTVKFFVEKAGTTDVTYKDLYNTSETYTVAGDGSITVKIPGIESGGTAVLVREGGQKDAATDTNKITLKVHYNRSDNNYADWNAWMWMEGSGGKQYDFAEENGEMVATYTIDDARKVSEVWYRIRIGDWKGNDIAGGDYDQSIDISDVLSGTVHYYIESGVKGGKRVLGADAITGVKPVSIKYDETTNTVKVVTSQPIIGTIEDAFTFICTSDNNREIDITRVEENVNEYTLYFEPDLSTLDNLMETYAIEMDGYRYNLNMPNYYVTELFEGMYTYEGDDLGVTFTRDGDGKITATTFKVWAPTAVSVGLNLYRSGTKGTNDKNSAYEMTKYMVTPEGAEEETWQGVWTYTINNDLHGTYYTYSVTRNNETVEACDPYARTTGVNGDRAMVIDMERIDAEIEGWEADKDAVRHEGMSYTDAIIYELHVRDLSIDESSGVSKEHQGKFLGLTETGTATENGTPTALDHMIDLGVTHLHLIPVYDYGSVDEAKDYARYQNLLDDDPENDDEVPAQFNWGYDPKNYNVPEGSYSTNANDGAVRVKEMKQMVKALHDNNINVIMDVVYNHVQDADNFCYNKIVPKYFSRTWADGSYSNGSGCGNDTASERAMVRNYIVDSILYWHNEYHIDGFRFDLVGLLDTVTINEIVEEVHKCDSDIIFYGEGWYMQNNTAVEERLIEYKGMADQGNSSKTPNFAYFSDTVRDNLSGRDTDKNGFIFGADKTDTMLACFKAQPGWTSNPIQTVNYASCHDNYTLMDKVNNYFGLSNLSYKTFAPTSEHAKVNNLAAAYYLFAEGIPLIHAGEEMLRIKLEEHENGSDVIHNSYNASDEVNKIRWSLLDRENAAGDLIFDETSDYYKGLIEFRKNHAGLRLDNQADVDAYVTCSKAESNAEDGSHATLPLIYIKGAAIKADDKEKTSEDEMIGEVSDGIVIVYNTTDKKQYIDPELYGIPAGTWQICVEGNTAGVEVIKPMNIDYSTDNHNWIYVEPRSTTAMVLGDTVDTDSVYTRNNRVTLSLAETAEVAMGTTTSVKEVIEVAVSPANSTLVWTSADETIATVDKDGNVTAVGMGTTTITAETLHGVKDTCEVTVTDASGMTLMGHTLSLEGNIGVNFIVDMDGMDVNNEENYVLFTLWDGSTQKVLAKDATPTNIDDYDGTYYAFTCEVASDEMTTDITAQFFSPLAKEGGKEYHYTVKAYADYILANPNNYDGKVVELVKAMLNYGAYSQQYFGTNEDVLANADLSAEDKFVPSSNEEDAKGLLKDYEVSAVTKEGLGTFASAYLVLESETTLKVRFKPAEGVNADDLSFTVDGAAAKTVMSGDDVMVVIENIKAQDLDKMFAIVASKGTDTLGFSCSTLSYGHAILNIETSEVYTAKLKNLIEALNHYNLAANVYCKD